MRTSDQDHVTGIDLSSSERLDLVRADFDRIADAGPCADADHSARYLDALLATLPPRVARALDLGCGAGDLVRRLAERADQVVGLDVAPRMIALARERCAAIPGVTFVTGDLMTCDLPERGFDVVCAVATLHHLPLADALARAASWVKPGGKLLVIDLFQPVGVGGFLHDGFSWLLARWLAHDPRRRPSRALRDAWRAHGAHDHYPTLAEVRRAARGLPGARVAVQPLWRWTLAWTRLSA